MMVGRKEIENNGGQALLLVQVPSRHLVQGQARISSSFFDYRKIQEGWGGRGGDSSLSYRHDRWRFPSLPAQPPFPPNRPHGGSDDWAQIS